MSVEIRELVIEASLKPANERKEGGAVELLTENDKEEIKREIIEEMSGSDDLFPESVRRKLIEDCLLAVRAMMDEANRR